MAVLLAVAPLSFPSAGFAEEEPDERGILTLQIENDVVTGIDRDYTNGLRLGYLSAEVAEDHWSRRISALVPFFRPERNLRYGIALGQNIYTPEDIERRDLIVDDRPYAAWLYFSLGVVSYDDTRDERGRLLRGGRLESLVLDVGVVGPSALGEEVQNNFHSLIGVDEAEGWDNQLEDELAFVLTYETAWRSLLAYNPWSDLGVELMPHVNVSIGNVLTQAGVGGSVRAGFKLPEDFGPPRIRPSLPGSDFFIPTKGLGGYLFAGLEGRAVLHNIFLDGNTFEDSHSVDSHPFVGEAQVGIAVTYESLRVSYTQVFRSPEFDEDSSWDRFGSLALSVRVPF